MTRVLESKIKIVLFEIEDTKRNHGKVFTLERFIGEGSSCIAYDAISEDGIPAVIKQFNPAVGKENEAEYERRKEEFLKACQDQITFLKASSVGNITAGLFEICHDDNDYIWTVTRKIYGETLFKACKKYPLETRLEWIRDVAEGVAEYHKLGYLVLDLKASNILLIECSGLKGVNFIDFDSFISKETLEECKRNGTPILIKSSNHFSASEIYIPETSQRKININDIDEKTDRFSVGSLMYYAVFQEEPTWFDAMPNNTFDFSEVEGIDAESARLITVFLRNTMCTDRDSRYESDEEMLHAIEAIVEFKKTALKEAKYLAERSKREYTCGNIREAVSLAIRSLSSVDDNCLTIPQAQLVLENALGCYTLNNYFLPSVTAIYSHDFNINNMEFFLDYNKALLFSCDADGWNNGFTIYIWDTSTNQIIYRETIAEERMILFRENLLDSKNNLLLYATDCNLICFDYSLKQCLWRLKLSDIAAACICHEKNIVYILTNEQIILIDEQTGKILQIDYLDRVRQGKDNYNCCTIDICAVSPDGQYFAFVFNDLSKFEYSKRKNYESVIIYDSIEKCFIEGEKNIGRLSKLYFLQNGNLLMSVIVQGGIAFRFVNQVSYGTEIVALYLVEPATGENIWKYEESQLGLYSDPYLKMFAATETQPERCLWSFGGEIRLLNVEEGTLIYSTTIPGIIIKTTAKLDADNAYISAFTRDGGTHLVYFNNELKSYVSLFEENDIVELKGINGYFVYSLSEKKNIKKYEFVQDGNFVLLEKLDDDFPLAEKCYLCDGIFAITNSWGICPAELIWTDTEADITSRFRLDTVIAYSKSLQAAEIIGISNDNGNRILQIRSTEIYSGESANYLVSVNLETGENTVEYAPVEEKIELPENNEIKVKTDNGQIRVKNQNEDLIFSTTYDSRTSIVTTEIVRDGKGLLAVFSDGSIVDYNMENGTVLNALKGLMAMIEDAHIKRIDDLTVACFIKGGLSAGGIEIINLSEGTWGLTSSIPDALEYDYEHDRFYVLSNKKFGYFNRYTVAKLKAMATERWQ